MTCIAYYCMYASGNTNPARLSCAVKLIDAETERLIAVLPTDTSDAKLKAVAKALGYELTEVA